MKIAYWVLKKLKLYLKYDKNYSNILYLSLKLTSLKIKS